MKTLVTLIGLINNYRANLSDKDRKVLASYKSMLRNVPEDGIGGESGVQPAGLRDAGKWTIKMLDKYGLWTI